MCSANSSEASPTLRVLPERINRVETRKLLRHYLLDQAEKAFLRRSRSSRHPGRCGSTSAA